MEINHCRTGNWGLTATDNPIECATLNNVGIDGTLGLSLKPRDNETPDSQETWLPLHHAVPRLCVPLL